MIKQTVTLVCTRCGKKFTYEFGDAVMPRDVKFMERPLCRRCGFIENLRKSADAYDKFLSEHPFITGPVIINPFRIIDKKHRKQG